MKELVSTDFFATSASSALSFSLLVCAGAYVMEVNDIQVILSSILRASAKGFALGAGLYCIESSRKNLAQLYRSFFKPNPLNLESGLFDPDQDLKTNTL